VSCGVAAIGVSRLRRSRQPVELVA
jgi:hypothetical protein